MRSYTGEPGRATSPSIAPWSVAQSRSITFLVLMLLIKLLSAYKPLIVIIRAFERPSLQATLRGRRIGRVRALTNQVSAVCCGSGTMHGAVPVHHYSLLLPSH